MTHWQDVKHTPPPDDDTEIEVRFGEQTPLRTTGEAFHRNVQDFGAAHVLVLWRLAPG